MGILSFASVLVLATSVLASPLSSEAGYGHIRFRSTRSVSSKSLHNIHIDYTKTDFTGDLAILFGECESATIEEHHHFIGRTKVRAEARPKRFVWSIPENAFSGGCLHAFSDGELVGRSGPVTIGSPLKRRQVISEVADTEGPWFDGVAYMQSKNNADAFVAEAKNKSKRPDLARISHV